MHFIRMLKLIKQIGIMNFITMSMNLLLLVVSTSFYLGVEANISYEGYQVVRCDPKTIEQLKYLELLQLDSDKMPQRGIEFWIGPRGLNQSVDIMAAPGRLNLLQEWLNEKEISFRIIIEDLNSQIRQQVSPLVLSRQSDNATLNADLLAAEYFYRSYQRYRAIEEKLKSLQNLDPRVTIETIGKSSEKRNLYLTKVSSNPEALKPIILIDAGHHAREWISHATLMYLLESIVNIDLPKITSRDCRVASCKEALARRTRLDLEHFDYWFVPVINPDGYEYTHTNDRLWRKTRSQDGRGVFNPCYGVDPNRNYGFHWNEIGSSAYSCSQVYAGSRAFSEPETRALGTLMQKNKDRIMMYLSLHAYSQLILTPYGYTREEPYNYQDLTTIAKAAAKRIGELRGLEYQYGSPAVILYPAAGASDDYAYGAMGIKYSFTIELPDKGDRGFMLPPSEIIPVGHEILLGIRAMTDAMKEIEKGRFSE